MGHDNSGGFLNDIVILYSSFNWGLASSSVVILKERKKWLGNLIS